MAQYSNLELVKNDAAANAPELDHFMDALELSRQSDAPEVVCSSGPQLAYSKTALIPVDDGQWKEDETKKHEGASKAYLWRLLGRSRIGCGLLALLVLIAVAVGVGVGVTTRSTSHAKAINSLTTQPKHGIFNDSSFAAVTTSDGSRHVFFQDTNINLRQAIFSPTIQGWISTVNIIPNTTDARSHTPISVTLQANPQGGLPEIVLIYINSRQHLAGATFSSGIWTNTTKYLNISQFIAAPASRSISLNVVPNTANFSELILFFEDSNGNVTGLHGTHSTILPSFTPITLWSWEDITNDIQPPSPAPRVTLSSPFSAGYTYETAINSTIPVAGIDAVFLDPYADSNSSFVWLDYSNRKFQTGTFGYDGFGASKCCHSIDTTLFKRSDLVQPVVGNLSSINDICSYYLWVNGTTLSSSFDNDQNLLNNPPTSPFPYARLATTTPDNGEAFYLYHQINESVFAEDVWDRSLGSWSSSAINIATT